MQLKKCVLLALTTSAIVYPQAQGPAPVAEGTVPHAFVRRFSVGATLSVVVTNLIPKGAKNEVTTTPVFDAAYVTTPVDRRIGYGGVVQVALTERFAVNASVLIRRAAYKMNSDIIEGTKHTVLNEDTRARFLDFPVLLRYYGTDRHEKGHRWFIEAGGALRQAKVKSGVDTTLNGTLLCCTDTAPRVAHKSIRGAVVGAGFQLIDPVGIRVVPGVRYTRWMAPTFNSFSTISNRNQIEGMISLTF
jgi:hypothetical protein